MMMTIMRRISFFILMTVNLVLILHAILPHHHHDDEVCFTKSHCSGQDDHEKSDCSDTEDHKHHNPSTSESCTLKATFLVPDGKGQVSTEEIQKILRQFVVHTVDAKECIFNIPGSPFLESDFSVDLLNARISGSSRILRGPPVLV